MPFLDVPDAFQIEVPDDWEATAVDGREYTLRAGDNSSLQIDIVVYAARTKEDALPAASTAAVRTWAKNIGMRNYLNLTVMTPTGGETPRAFASIPREERDVYVGFFYFKKSFVVAAGSAHSGDRAGLTRVEQLLWSIEAG